MSDTAKNWLGLLLLLVMALAVTVCLNYEPASADASADEVRPNEPACTQDSTVLNSTGKVYRYTQCDNDGDGDIDEVIEDPGSAEAKVPDEPCFYSGGDKWCDIDGDGIADTVTAS
jgi:hypothetical protein